VTRPVFPDLSTRRVGEQDRHPQRIHKKPLFPHDSRQANTRPELQEIP